MLSFRSWILQGRRYRGHERLDGRVCIITGCNTGIGREHALDLARRGARVYMACRDQRRCEAARLDIVERSGNQNVFNWQLDLASLASVRAFVRRFLATGEPLHLLVNNAAIIPAERQLTVDGFEMQMGVNHMGPFLLTTLLLDVLKRSAPARIVLVSSTAHVVGRIRRDDLNTERRPYSQMSNYCDSKLANVLFMRSLARRLEGSGVTVNALHPGVVRTELLRDLTFWNVVLWVFTFYYRTPRAGAQTQIRVSVDAALETVTGRYFDDCREKRMADRAYDEETAEWLWRTSEEWTAEKTVTTTTTEVPARD